MDYKKIYNEDYFSGKNSFFYWWGYGRFSKHYFNWLYRSLKSQLNLTASAKILDAGCAYGFMLQRFPDSCKKFGIDVSDYAITKAKIRLPNAEFRIGNVEDSLPYQDNFFDVIICNDVLEHLEHPEKAINNIHKALKPGGIFYMNSPNLNKLRKIIFSFPDRKEHHISLKSHTEVGKLLVDNGFEIIDTWTYTNLSQLMLKFRSNFGLEQAYVCRKVIK